MPRHFYNDQDEYRWEYPHIGQGHYILAHNMDEAAQIAVTEARRSGLGNEIVIQRWKPSHGKKYRLLVQTWKSIKGWR